MTTPVTGPFLRVLQQSGTTNGRGVYKASRTYRQAKPYNLRLPYRMLKSVCYAYQNWIVPTGIPFTGGGAWSTGSLRPLDLWFNEEADPLPTLRNRALTRAWDQLNSEISESAEWLVTVLQRQQAISMATARATQFLRFLNAVRRGRFGDAVQALHIDARDPKVQEAIARAKKHMRRRNKSSERVYGGDARFSNFDKRVGSAVLEFNFGWAPTLGDIYNTMDLLQSEVPAIPVKGKGRSASNVVVNMVTGHETVTGNISYNMKASLTGDFVIENPNLFLAGRLGLLNPAIVLYEMTPWSFVGNWFLNLETMIRAYSPQWGYRWENATTTFSLYSESDITGVAYNGSQAFARQLRFSQIRYTGLKKPRLGLRDPSGYLNLTRLANAVSLILQRLR